jgi:hypothetical protein
MLTVMSVVSLWAVLLPIIGIAVGALKIRRDAFLLLVYAQSVIYIDVAPVIASVEVTAAAQARYSWLQAWALVLFQAPLLAIYAFRMRKVEVTPRTLGLSSGRLALFSIGAAVLGAGYMIVALKYGILYRRLSDELVTVQMSMNIVEFAVYRVFVELGPFLLAVMLLIGRLSPPRTAHDRLLLRAGFLLTLLPYLAYVLINSRLMAVVILATLFAMWTLLSVQRRGLRTGAALAVILAGGTALYSVRVVENIRMAVFTGGNMFAPRNFLPVSAYEGPLDDVLKWRLNGLDLMAIIADNVETQGPAWGTAWAGPFIVSLDPIVRTPLTVDMKLAGLTTAKSFLLLRYGGVAKTDYYNCMLSDAYGNFGRLGFLVVAIVLASLFGWATSAVATSASPAMLITAAFFLTRGLPFEQEFATLLYGWFKLVPFVAAVVVLSPLRARLSRTIDAPTLPTRLTAEPHAM